MSVNKVILLGNVGKDPEIRSLESGVKVATFSLATSKSWKDKSGERKEATEWHNIVVWRGLADVVEKYITKGKQVYIEGEITTRKWEDKDGNTRYTTEIVANQLQMIGKKAETAEVVSGGSTQSNSDGLPF